jgi:DNA end-binding protein Ku
MPAYLWSGTLTFGLVTLPVQITTTVNEEGVSFKMLHAKDYAPLEQKYVCTKDDKVVPASQRARGFPVGKNEYVIVTDAELESLEPERSRAIEIERFVDLEEIDPIYFDRPYYLMPEEGSERPYSLLVKALAETGRVGIAKFIMKEREYLVAVHVVEKALCLTVLHFERQRVSAKGLAPEKTRFNQKELKQLAGHIRKATRGFDSSDFKDEYEIELMKIVHKKAKEEGAVKSPKTKRKKVRKSKAARTVKRTLDRVKEK